MVRTTHPVIHNYLIIYIESNKQPSPT